MEKQKRWQFYLIVAVIVLTLINILPTVFYYAKPLKSPITEPRALRAAERIITRVNQLEQDSKQWLLSYGKNLSSRPLAIALKENNPGLFEVSLRNKNDAELFKRFLSRAGALIPFVPAQLSLYPGFDDDDKTVLVKRNIQVHLEPSDLKSYFHFYKKREDGELTEAFKSSIYDRAEQLALHFGGPSKVGTQIANIAKMKDEKAYDDLTVAVSKEIVDVYRTFGAKSPITKRYLSSLLQIHSTEREPILDAFVARGNRLNEDFKSQIQKIDAEKEDDSLDPSSKKHLSYLQNKQGALQKALAIIKENKEPILQGNLPLSSEQIQESLSIAEKKIDPQDPMQRLPLKGHTVFVKNLAIDWDRDQILLELYPDIQKIREGKTETEEESFVRDKLNSYIINEIARISRNTQETIAPAGPDFAIKTTHLTNAKSFLAFDLTFLAKKAGVEVHLGLLNDWQPEHTDFMRKVYPVMDYETYKKLPPQEKKLGLIVYAPAMFDTAPPKGFRNTSIYVIAKGLDAMIQKTQDTKDTPESQMLAQDINTLTKLLEDKGFFAYKGSMYGVSEEFANDYIFELDDYYTMLLGSTREDFYVLGSKRKAVLDFTDVEQRIIALNRIQDRIHEDLLKWRDDYNATQVNLDATERYYIPPPAKNVYLDNLKLTLAKYFRGDERKILRWGLDLSGGKTVRIGLRDENNRIVTNPEDLKTAVDDLYTRINKMGVSERTIRIENDNIILDFPGSQAFSAAELVKASAMYFHIVNEKFSLRNVNLREHVNDFLQNVWNEAVVTNRKDIESINTIAFEQLGGNQTGEFVEPRSESAKILVENGLRLANPRDGAKSSAFDDTLSSIAIFRGEDYVEKFGQTHPLVIVFHNYALEGSSLGNIQVGYDPSQGNLLSFTVKSSYDGEKQGNPRDDLQQWSSQFAEDKIAGTPKEAYSQGAGWRMAVILNNAIVTQPALRQTLRDSGSISGHFSQREVNQLAADLKAGSLKFTPKILSEQNVSAELGKEERTKGIIASVFGLALVAFAMIGYYRFAGFVATCAVLLNLLIMWGVLQNLGAALTLPGIAGIVLTIGMAVDANVLVFERIREEFKISGRIATAIQAGYNKAFSAIVDSNITTILAALILIQFDSGPIKGFAVTLIIGLVSSMFTALFMTRYFFAGWVQNPKHKMLRMAEFIKGTKIDFLSYAKPALLSSLVIILVGGYFFYTQKNTLFGMDFTGGYSLTVDLQEESGKTDYRQDATNALLAKGASSTDFEIRELNKPNNLRIQLALSMEEKGHPFYDLPEVSTQDEVGYEYQKDGRIVWVVNALESAGLNIQESDLINLDKHWSMMSGQFSSKMRNNALLALGIALISILIYITFRFEFKYAISAVIALTQDVMITLGLLALLKRLGLPVQIDLEVVGAIMTVVGYSLNNTIIVFDRIREDIVVYRKLKFNEIINHALNITLGRTLMTSATTLLVLFSLVFLGGYAIFDFSLVMTIGVIVGTFTSLFIASPVMLFFHHRENQNETALKRV